MLKNIFANSRVQTILVSLLALFTVTQVLKYMDLYEGMENKKDVKTSTEHKKLAKSYNF
jgi:hypothetical protein